MGARTLSPWRVLGIDEDAKPEAVKAAYRRLAQLFHPDRNDSEAATEMMRIVNLAYAAVRELPPAKRPRPRPSSYARSFVLRFGKHTGQSVEDVWKNDPQYVVWLAENLDDGPTLDAVLDYMGGVH